MVQRSVIVTATANVNQNNAKVSFIASNEVANPPYFKIIYQKGRFIPVIFGFKNFCDGYILY